MKAFFTALCITLSLATCVMAQDGMPSLNEQNIQKFIQVLPKYRSLVEEYGEAFAPESSIPTATKLGNEINALLTAHGLSMQEFPLLAQKISLGFAALQMEAVDMGPMAGMFGNLPQFNNITPAEKSLLQKYSNQLKQVFESE